MLMRRLSESIFSSSLLIVSLVLSGSINQYFQSRTHHFDEKVYFLFRCSLKVSLQPPYDEVIIFETLVDPREPAFSSQVFSRLFEVIRNYWQQTIWIRGEKNLKIILCCAGICDSHFSYYSHVIVPCSIIIWHYESTFHDNFASSCFTI